MNNVKPVPKWKFKSEKAKQELEQELQDILFFTPVEPVQEPPSNVIYLMK